MEHGSKSEYYEKYRDAMANLIQKALLDKSELFFKDANYTYYGAYGAFLLTQVRKTLRYDFDFV